MHIYGNRCCKWRFSLLARKIFRTDNTAPTCVGNADCQGVVEQVDGREWTVDN